MTQVPAGLQPLAAYDQMANFMGLVMGNGQAFSITDAPAPVATSEGKFIKDAGRIAIPVDGPDEHDVPDYERRAMLEDGNASASGNKYRPAEDSVGSTYMQMRAERNWYALGRPTYKIYPGMVEALAETSIDIPAEHFKMPFPAIVLRLPRHYMREHDDAPWLQAILITTCWMRYDREFAKRHHIDAGRHLKLQVFSSFEEPPGGSPMMNHIRSQMNLAPGMTLQHSLDVMPFQEDPRSEVYWPSRGMTKKLLALSLGTCFIAVGKDKKLIKKEKREGLSVRDRLRRGGRRWDPSKIPNTDLGWGVGSDIKLPKADSMLPGDPRPDVDPDPDRQLRYGHVRSGHMRWQPYGPKDDPTYKLIFIAPTVVRNDLPLKPRNTPRAVTRKKRRSS